MMENNKKLNDEELKKVVGGAIGDIPINDSMLQSIIGYTWEGLAATLNPFLEHAANMSYTSYVNEIKNLLKTKAVNPLKIVSYKTSLNALKPVAEGGGFTNVVAIIDNLLEILNLF